MVTALFVARLQPLHKGHEHALKQLLKEYDKVVIAIGSTGKSDRKNPFSYNERKRMVNAAMKKYSKSYRITGIPDFASDKKWAEYIKKKARFDAVATGNTWTRKCLKGCKIIKPEMLRPKLYSATRIRKLINKKEKWEHLVPKAVVPVIKRHFAILHL